MTATIEIPPGLTSRWYPLRNHNAQAMVLASGARFDVIEAGRRSGKTEIVKRAAVLEARHKAESLGGETWYTKLCAPTRDQAKFIFWEDIKALSEPWWTRDPSESELRVFMSGGAEIWICGLDKPQRIEGSPVDRLGCDELADVKMGAWEQNLRPALDTEHPSRPDGRAWLFGVPRPGLQFAKLAELAQDPDEPDFAYHHWTAATVLSPEKIESAKRTMDPRTYEQEYEAKRANMEGLAYYQWSRDDHLKHVVYNPARPLIFCFDFNVEPGVAAVLQELTIESENYTCAVGEVHIPRNSNTPAVCRKLCADWKHHEGDVHVYGDASGGARHTSQENQKSDWDLVRQELRKQFGDRVRMRVGNKNPEVRDRINAVNCRMRNTADEVRFAVNPKRCPRIVEDFEGVTLLEGGSGEIDKKGCEAQGLTHLTDAIGYYIEDKFPVQLRDVSVW